MVKVDQRVKKILKEIVPHEQVGLELGPLNNPVVLRSNDVSIYYADHMSTNELRRKYYDHSFDTDDIVNIDYVINAGSTLSESVQGKTFDYVVASHVIEHIPNIIGWLNDIGKTLKPNGVLSLVIPDKRFTFDVNRHLSVTGELLNAHLLNITSATPKMIYDHYIGFHHINSHDAWSGEVDGVMTKPDDDRINYAIDKVNTTLDGNYIDAHLYTFTPASFFEIMRQITVLGLISYEVESFSDTQDGEYEFFVSLRKSDKHISDIVKTMPNIATPDHLYDHKIKSLEVSNNELKNVINSIHNSRSWKVVEVLRHTFRLIKG